jgi:hypothetical protein
MKKFVHGRYIYMGGGLTDGEGRWEVYYVRSTVDGSFIRWITETGELSTPNEVWIPYHVGALKGQLINPDENGIPGTVIVYDSAGREVARMKTDEYGNWMLPKLKPDTYRIYSYNAAYLSGWQSMRVEPDRTSEGKLVLAEDVENPIEKKRKEFCEEYEEQENVWSDVALWSHIIEWGLFIGGIICIGLCPPLAPTLLLLSIAGGGISVGASITSGEGFGLGRRFARCP